MANLEIPGIHLTAQQLLLLDTLFSSGEAVFERYRQWAAQTDFDSLDGGSFRLMPMLYRKLAPFSIRDERFEKIKGIYRYTLYKNSTIMAGFANIAKALHGEGIDLILLKGGALDLVYYKDRGIRPMSDIDILIKKENLPRALTLLQRLGWHANGQVHYDPFFCPYPSITLVGRYGFELDLHWNIMREYGNHDFSSELWRESIPISYHGVPVRILGPEDQVMHTCAHGIKWNAVPSIRWIPDLMILLKAEPGMSWQRLARKCEERKLTLAVRSCLRFVTDHFNAPVARATLDMLAAQPLSGKDREIFRAHTSPPTFIGRIVRQWRLNKIDFPDRPLAVRLLLFPGYLKRKSGIERYSDCMKYLLAYARKVLATPSESC